MSKSWISSTGSVRRQLYSRSAIFDEGRLYHPCRELSLSYPDGHVITVFNSCRSVDESDRYPAPENPREVTASDFTDHLSVGFHRVALSRRPPTFSDQTSEAPSGARFPLALESGFPAEPLLVPTDDPAEPCLKRGDARSQLVVVERETRLEAKGVARSEPGGPGAGSGHRVPEVRSCSGWDRALDSVLTGVPGSGDGARDAAPFEP